MSEKIFSFYLLIIIDNYGKIFVSFAFFTLVVVIFLCILCLFAAKNPVNHRMEMQ